VRPGGLRPAGPPPRRRPARREPRNRREHRSADAEPPAAPPTDPRTAGADEPAAPRQPQPPPGISGFDDAEELATTLAAAEQALADPGTPDDLRSAVYAYNHSERYVDAVLAHAETIAHFDHYLDVRHRWRVYDRTVDGDLILEEGYGS
jgi:hypothetical protein